MSLDVYLTAVRPTVVYDRNITHNLNVMADAARGQANHAPEPPDDAKDYAIERAGYLANCARDLLVALNLLDEAIIAREESDSDYATTTHEHATDIALQARARLLRSIYEFEGRAALSAAPEPNRAGFSEEAEPEEERVLLHCHACPVEKGERCDLNCIDHVGQGEPPPAQLLEAVESAFFTTQICCLRFDPNNDDAGGVPDAQIKQAIQSDRFKVLTAIKQAAAADGKG